MVGFWERHQTSGAPFLDKGLLAKNQTPFNIEGVRLDSENKYGPQWVLRCTVDRAAGFELDLDGATEFQLGFTDTTGWRTAMMEDLRTELSENGSLRAIVISFENKRGETGYDIGPVPNEQLSFTTADPDTGEVPF